MRKFDVRLLNPRTFCARQLVVASLLIAAMSHNAGANTLPDDPFARDEFLAHTSLGNFERLTNDVVLGRRGAEANLLTWIDRDPHASIEHRRDAWLALCAARFRQQRFTEAVPACQAGEDLEQGAATSMLKLLEIRQQAPATSWSSSSVLVSMHDGRIAVSHGEITVEARVDTGAQVAFVSETAARTLAGVPLSGSATIGTTTTPVAGSMVTFPVLNVGAVELRYLTAVVMSDEQIAYSEESLILDLATVTSLRRAAFLDHGTRLALGEAAARIRGTTTPLYWDQSGVGFAVNFAGGRRGVHFDTGSRRSYLYPAATNVLSAAERATSRPFQRKIGGLGGERIEQATILRHVTLVVARRPWVFDEIEMAESDEHGESARVGTGLWQRFETVALDFDRMQMTVCD